MPLSDMTLRRIGAVTRDTKLSDGGGLYLLVRPNGSRLWRMKYRWAGKERALGIGPYPLISLAAARQKRDDAKRLLLDGRDPKEVRRAAERAASGLTFAAVVAEYEAKREKESLGGSALRKDKQMFGHALPAFGSRPIASITAPEILEAIRRVEARGNHDTAHRMRATVSRVFRFAIASGYAETDPAAHLVDALVRQKVVNHPRLTGEREIQLLWRRISGYSGYPATRTALQLLLLTFVRPRNVRFAEWAEFDLSKGLWRIPAVKMKMARDHIVPLAPQAIRVIETWQEMARPSRYLFPLVTSVNKPISDSTMNTALRIMGYDTRVQVNGHGFRGTASTALHESGLWRSEVVERQLAHVEGGVRAVYNAAEYLDERVRMMRWWADLLEGREVPT